MGITSKSIERINRYLKPNDKILIIGCQNLYNAENYGEIAQDYYRALGHDVKSIDVYECNGAEVADLRDDLHFGAIYDQVWNHGTVEHIDGSIYWAFRNMHEACKTGGVMIHENPASNNWPGHGQHYFTTGFYLKLALACKYELLEVDTEAAMGNTTDGWNIVSVLKKLDESKFITEVQFNKLYAKYIFPK